MNPVQRAISIIEGLSPKKLYAALYILEMLSSEKDKDLDLEDVLVLKAFETSCEEEELTPLEAARVTEGEAELKAGLGVKAEDVWKELGL